jgi:hypothetical protein
VNNRALKMVPLEFTAKQQVVSTKDGKTKRKKGSTLSWIEFRDLANSIQYYPQNIKESTFDERERIFW